MAIVTSVVLGPRLFLPADESTSDGQVVVAAVAPDRVPAVPSAAPADSRSSDTVVAEPPASPRPDTSSAPTLKSEPEGFPPAPPTTEAIEVDEPEPTSPITEAPTPPTTTTTTTTTEAPPPPTTVPPPPPEPEVPVPAALSAEHGDGTQVGDVSWYDLPGSVPGVCAHRTIEKGTVVTVTNLDTGKSTTCLVDDRGPYSGDEKVLDLHRDEFSRLAPLEQGIFTARLDW